MLSNIPFKINASVNWIAENYSAPFFAIAGILWLCLHLLGNKNKSTGTGEVLLGSLLILGTVTIFVDLAIERSEFSFARMASLLFLYGVALFVLLSKAMRHFLAAWLTKKRGEQWVKELDYLYLTIGSVGILGSVNRLPFITGKIEAGDLIAPVLLTTAIVIRFIKTRAEIAGWNKIL